MNESKPTEDVEVSKKEKPKKDKLMKKFSFRAFSFGKKDKQKPQTAKDAEGAAATANVSKFNLFHRRPLFGVVEWLTRSLSTSLKSSRLQKLFQHKCVFFELYNYSNTYATVLGMLYKGKVD